MIQAIIPDSTATIYASIYNITFNLFLWTLGVKLCTDAPAASSATMFAEKYNCDAPYVSRLVTVSTILCIATMPLIVMLVQAW